MGRQGLNVPWKKLRKPPGPLHLNKADVELGDCFRMSLVGALPAWVSVPAQQLGWYSQGQLQVHR